MRPHLDICGKRTYRRPNNPQKTAKLTHIYPSLIHLEKGM